VRVVASSILLFALAAAPSTAAAQVTLVIRAGAHPHARVDGVVDDRLRDRLGGMIRHVDASLDELALAAGCDPSSDVEGASCIATIASAAGARLVAIERIAHRGTEWRFDVDVRSADGTPVTTIGARCDEPGACGEGIDDPAPADDAHARPPIPSTHAHAAPPRVESTVAATPDGASTATTAPRVGHFVSVVPCALFAGAVLLGIGSFVAGGLALDSYRSAIASNTGGGPSATTRQHALEDQSAIELGTGIALAGVGAILAVAGIITFVGRDGPRLQIGANGIALSVNF
jgi:hypothetical protein